ncbi:MAG: C4-type zinc ribbon domain-containing protein [Ignavibacteria bacterium]
MKERILQLYKLNQVDKELHELISLRGDIPAKIEDLSSEKNELDERAAELKREQDEIISAENNVAAENDHLLEKIEKNDELLRSGAVKSNKEYDALAREIDDAKTKIQENEKASKEDNSARKSAIENELTLIAGQLEDVNVELEQNLKELEELTKQTGEEETELNSQREEIIKTIEPEDIAYYDRISKVRFGEAVAIVRKGSCLGCYSSIPPQKAIEIRMAEKFFACESCGRILIAEEMITA